MSSAKIKRYSRITSRLANSEEEEEPTACLVQRSCIREDKNNIKQDIFLEGKEVTVGRSPDSTIILKSIDISRRHAVFKLQNGGTWSVQDSRSSNGVYINRKKLELNESSVLKDGDIVHFGPPDVTSFEYVFFYLSPFKTPKVTQASCSSATPATPSVDIGNSDSEANSSFNQPELNPLEVPIIQTSFAEISSILHSNAVSASDGNIVPPSTIEGCVSVNSASESGTLESAHGDEGKSTILSGGETTKAKSVSPLTDANGDTPDLKKRLKELEEMLKEKEKIQIALQESLEEKVKELQKLKHQESIPVEEGGGANTSGEIHEIDNAPEPVMEIVIDDEVPEVVVESEEPKVQADKQTTSDIKESFEKVLDSELTCAICSELFVQAITLQCSHTFCAFCISQWKVNKKICPICRAKIVTETRSLVVDNFIDRMVENLGQDAKNRRQALVEARKNTQKTKGSSVSVPIIIDGNTGRVGATNTRASTSAANATIVVSSDSESESSFGPDESDFDSDSSVEGHPDAYYGGYGFCFNCGRRGHWAPGCPF